MANYYILLIQLISVFVICQAALKKPDDTCKDKQGNCAEDPSCWNQHRCCEIWAGKNQCKENSIFMKTDCKAACGYCTPHYQTLGDVPGPACADHFAKCSKWSDEGECKKNPDWMNNNCRKSCDVCHLFTKESLTKRCVLDGSKAGMP